jgi:hypothetical protein
MRILKGLSGRMLPCGCLTGVYETYDRQIIEILDARGSCCRDSTHQPGKTLPPDPADNPNAPSVDRPVDERQYRIRVMTRSQSEVRNRWLVRAGLNPTHDSGTSSETC